MKKNPWVAAVLNFFFFGGGTLYVGRRVVPALLLIAGGTTVQVIELKVSPVGDFTAIPSLWPFLLAGLFVLKMGLAVDGYREAKAVV